MVKREVLDEEGAGPSLLPSHFAEQYTYSSGQSSPAIRRSPRKAAPVSRLDLGSLSQKVGRTPNARAKAEEDDEDLDDNDDEGDTPPHKSSRNGSASPKKRQRIRRGIDNPNASRYAHLNGLPDHFGMENDIMFCGINPGVMSSTKGHHFAHRSNHFYPSLHLSGITSRRIDPSEDWTFPSLEPFSLGLTNLADRPTAESKELTPSELVASVPTLLAKIHRWHPRTVCFVGKGIAQSFIKGLTLSDDTTQMQLPITTLLADAPKSKRSPGKAPRPTKESVKDNSGYGLLPFCYLHDGIDQTRTLFFVTPSSSARVTTHFLADKAHILSHLRTLVQFLQNHPAGPAKVEQGGDSKSITVTLRNIAFHPVKGEQ